MKNDTFTDDENWTKPTKHWIEKCFTYFSIDERLNDDNLGSMMNLLNFTG